MVLRFLQTEKESDRSVGRMAIQVSFGQNNSVKALKPA